MRRSASEIISELERRVARLEKQAKTTITDVIVDDKKDVVYLKSGRRLVRQYKWERSLKRKFLRSEVYTRYLSKDIGKTPLQIPYLTLLVDERDRVELLDTFDFNAMLSMVYNSDRQYHAPSYDRRPRRDMDMGSPGTYKELYDTTYRSNRDLGI